MRFRVTIEADFEVPDDRVFTRSGLRVYAGDIELHEDSIVGPKTLKESADEYRVVGIREVGDDEL